MPHMPRAALARSPVDHTLPPSGIAALIEQLHQQRLL
jgi:two-component system chemotaxis response regulator CheB